MHVMKESHQCTPAGLPRARSIGVPFDGRPGPHNAITDVPGVEVGYVTLIEGSGSMRVGHGPVRTGVTAILPRGKQDWGACAAGWHSFNGNGEMTGSHWLTETGILSSAVMLTNTYAVGTAHRGVVDWINQNRPGQLPWEFPVVGETYDGYLSDVSGAHVTPGHAVTAIDRARSGPLDEGSVGGGTGMCCYGYKGGSGTASRLVAIGTGTYTVGAFVQANFGRRRHLTVAGRPVGKALPEDNPMEAGEWFLPAGAGSVIVVVATDAPLLPQQCSAPPGPPDRTVPGISSWPSPPPTRARWTGRWASPGPAGCPSARCRSWPGTISTICSRRPSRPPTRPCSTPWWPTRR
jgi:L-aminopeptidase/D-esterase-like protein